MNHLEQCYAIKFCVKLNKSPSETVQLLSEAYPTDRLSKTQIYEWHKRFRDGRENVESELGQGRTATSTTQENIIAVENLLNENPRLTVRKIAGTLGISLGSCHSMLHEQLGMSRVCSRWVPRLLTNQMKVDRVTKAQEILDRYFHEGEAFLKRIVTGDEVWLHYYDPETKQQSSEWKRPTEPTPLKPRATKSAGKIMAVFFFDSEGVIYRYIVPRGTTVTGNLYIEILANLRDAVNKKRPHLRDQRWLLHHDNAPSHTAGKVMEFLHRNDIEIVPHPPYSPDLAPCDFFYFPNLKLPLRGNHFQTDNELIRAVGDVERDLQKNGLLHVFYKWTERLRKCIDIGGGYVEKE